MNDTKKDNHTRKNIESIDYVFIIFLCMLKNT